MSKEKRKKTRGPTKRISMHPLDPDEAIKGIMQVPKEKVDEAEQNEVEEDGEEQE